MVSVPYIYIPLIALVCYLIMLTAFLAAKKTQEIYSFILCIAGFMLWTGGSLFMRLQIAPGPYFWYEVSILSLFTLGLLYYYFVSTFAKARGFLLKTVWTAGTAIILVLTHFEVFLKRPEIVVLADGSTVFSYTMEWPIVIPCIFFAMIVLSIVAIMIRMIRENGIKAPGVKAVVAGCAIMFVGNIVSIIPNNYFPWDTLAGIFNAFCLIYALYRKRIFRLKLLISRSTLLIISAVMVFGASSYFVYPMEKFIAETFPVRNATVYVVFLFTVLTGAVYMLLKKLFDRLFSRDEQQGRTLESFSSAVARTLQTGEILKELVTVTQNEIAVDRVYVCLLQDGRYKAQLSSNPLDSVSFSIKSDNPCIALLQAGEPCIILNEFRSNTLYKSMWESEKQLLDSLNIGCIVGIMNDNEVNGLLLLKNKSKNASFTDNDTAFLGTVGSIVSIALKNAVLYERVYKESRIDSLTGLYNHKYFSEKIEEEFEKQKEHLLTLLYLDVDDFKLYNQLYGMDAGDDALRQIAAIIMANVGSSGIVSRTSGKVFAVILPREEPRQAYRIALNINQQISRMNDTPERVKYKAITVSCGICAYPYAASSVRELIDNADLAVYNAKNSGKNSIRIYSLEDKQNTRSRTEDPVLFAAEMQSEVEGQTGYRAHAAIISAMTAAIHAKDHYTFDHSQNVARYATILASVIGMNAEHIRIIYEAALLHDIGKISIPESILCKKSRLENDEYEIMKGHVYSAIDMIRHLPSMDYVIPAAIGHHERWDGKGYPRGIAGEEIPVSARCLAIADAFDAMTSARPYRDPMSIEAAAGQIEDNAGTQFDPKLAIIFAELVRRKKITLNPDSNLINAERIPH